MRIKENGTIIIPTDFSEQSLAAIKNSYNIARFTKSQLFLLHAFYKADKEQAERLRELASQTEKESGLKCDFLSLTGNIYEEAKKWHGNLIPILS